MRGNGKVFISHTHNDNEICAPLLAALDAWGMDYWFDTQQLDPGQHLSERIQEAIAERDIFIRVCTPATQNSYWMTLEMNAFRGLQLDDQQRKRGNRRLSVNLVLAPGYQPAVSDRADLLIEASNRPPRAWLSELRDALELTVARARRMSRRAALGLGVATLVTAGAVAGGGVVLAQEHKAAVRPPYPKPKVIPFTNPQTLDPRVKWYFKAGDDEAGLSLTLGDGVLYLTSGDGLYALKPDDATILWINGKVSGGPALVRGKILYADSGLGDIYALNTSDGSAIWTAQTGNIFLDSAYALGSDAIFAYSADDTIDAYNISDGSRRWRSKQAVKSDLLQHGPTAAGSTVYAGSSDGNLYAFKTSDGSVVWQHLTGGPIVDAPTVANGVVYFGSKDKYVYALNAADGSLKWRHQAGFDVDLTPTITGGVCYIGLEQYLYALDANTGKGLWKAPVADLDASGNPTGLDFVGGTAAVAGDLVYVTAGAYLYAVSAQQRKYVWRFKTRDFNDNRSTPIVVGDVVYFAGDNHTLYALSAS
ncbi:MAG TPA: toll/interleukin-1 receptor domain-containing protein [Ktedonobacterales bacterium]|nr:toll/interleukin-1 receptor domain-containing protein [Ktedonobacterales bacterium]